MRGGAIVICLALFFHIKIQMSGQYPKLIPNESNKNYRLLFFCLFTIANANVFLVNIFWNSHLFLSYLICDCDWCYIRNKQKDQSCPHKAAAIVERRDDKIYIVIPIYDRNNSNMSCLIFKTYVFCKVMLEFSYVFLTGRFFVPLPPLGVGAGCQRRPPPPAWAQGSVFLLICRATLAICLNILSSPTLFVVCGHIFYNYWS